MPCPWRPEGTTSSTHITHKQGSLHKPEAEKPCKPGNPRHGTEHSSELLTDLSQSACTGQPRLQPHLLECVKVLATVNATQQLPRCQRAPKHKRHSIQHLNHKT